MGDGKRKVDFIISAGSGGILISQKLFQEKLISSPFGFRILLFIKGKRKEIKKGIFELNNSMKPGQIIDEITDGRTKVLKITVPEGFNNRQIADLFKAKGFFESREEFLQYASELELLKKYNIPAKNAEGYLYPETYFIPAGYSKKKILDLMVNTFFQKTSGLMDFNLEAGERHKLLILASVVEREAKVKKERPIIAGVFLNRLKTNYPLESCATVQYLFEKPKKRLLFKHLKIQSPYNTYLRKGLPPGPISNPGLLSIEATLNPARNDFKYFVLLDDGKHKFSRTYAEHLIARKKYLQKNFSGKKI
jgi:UPF0755 protein